MRQIINGEPITYTLDLAAPLVTVLAEKQATGNQTYLYGLGDSPLASYDGAWRYLSGRDGLNSVRQETDAAGNVIATRSFDPYGVPMGEDGGSPFGYTGEQYDGDTGLVFLRARMYQPMLGIFVSRDQGDNDDLRPLTYHEWMYTEGNPINYADPSGLCVFCEPGDRVRVDARPDRITPIYARPDQNSLVVDRVQDNGWVRVSQWPTQGNGRDEWRRVLTVNSRSGWILNRKLLDNCEGPPGMFGCLPVAAWNSQANWNWGFGPSQFAYNNCAAGLNTPACRGTYFLLRGLHNGLDFVASTGSTLVWPGTGNGTVLDNPYPNDAESNIVIEFGARRVLFGHRSASYVNPGAQVRPGQAIGESGRNGGEHLHFGVRSGRTIHYNPLYYFTPALQDTIVRNMGAYYVPERGYGGFNAYSIISFDAAAAGGASFWDDCPDYTGIVFRVLHN